MSDNELDELRRDLAWRATRYAMAGQWDKHDTMLEALCQLVGTVTGYYEDIDCDCATSYHRGVA